MKGRIISKYIPEIGKVMYYPQIKVKWFLFSYWDYQCFSYKYYLPDSYYKLHGNKKAFDSLEEATESLRIEMKTEAEYLKSKNKVKSYGIRIHKIDL
jgi:hypothetical protein